MRQFEVGKSYEPYQREYGEITVDRRTEHTIWVHNEVTSWSMRVRHTAEGNEIAIDCSVPRKYRECFTYEA